MKVSTAVYGIIYKQDVEPYTPSGVFIQDNPIIIGCDASHDTHSHLDSMVNRCEYAGIVLDELNPISNNPEYMTRFVNKSGFLFQPLNN